MIVISLLNNILYYCCPIKKLQRHKNRADFICDVSPFLLDFCRQTKSIQLWAKVYILADSRKNRDKSWMKRIQIIDSTTITLFSNLLFKGVGRHPKTGKKKGGIKVHTVIHANEGVPSDIKFTSAATNDSFMLRPSVLNKGDIIAMDRAYIDYEKLETLTQREVLCVTKMKKNLRYNIMEDCMYQTKEGFFNSCKFNFVDRWFGKTET